MGRTLVAQCTNTFTEGELLQMYNSHYSKNFTSLAIAVASVGITAVTLAIKSKSHPLVATTLAAISAAITFGSALTLVANSLTSSKFTTVVQNMLRYGGSRVRVRTYVYDWLSGSGNHYTRITEHVVDWY